MRGVPTSATPPALGGTGKGPGAPRRAGRCGCVVPVETPPHLRAFGPGGSGRSARGREGSVARGRAGPAQTAPSGALGSEPRAARRGVGAAALRSGRSGAASAFRAACVSCGFAPGAGPAPRERASASPGARGWRRRGWRAGRRLLAPRRRPGPALLGTWENFPGAGLAAEARGSLGRAPLPPKSESAEPGRAPGFLLQPRRGGGGEVGGVGGRGPRAGSASGRRRGRSPGARAYPPRRPGRSAGIAPVGGLGAALGGPSPAWERLSPRRRPAAQLGFSGVSVETAILEVTAKVKGNLPNASTSPFLGGPAAVLEGISLGKRSISPERCTKF